MRNATRPRHASAQSTAEVPNKAISFSENPRPDAPEMFNILLALESARGLLSVRDVARLLGKSIFTVYRLAEQRKIPSLVIGRLTVLRSIRAGVVALEERAVACHGSTTAEDGLKGDASSEHHNLVEIERTIGEELGLPSINSLVGL